MMTSAALNMTSIPSIKMRSQIRCELFIRDASLPQQEYWNWTSKSAIGMQRLRDQIQFYQVFCIFLASDFESNLSTLFGTRGYPSCCYSNLSEEYIQSIKQIPKMLPRYYHWRFTSSSRTWTNRATIKFIPWQYPTEGFHLPNSKTYY